MRRECVKAVVWRRELSDGKGGTIFHYAIVGAIVTGDPVPELERNETVLCGSAAGLCEVLSGIRQVPAEVKIGDANMVLTTLDEIVGTRTG